MPWKEMNPMEEKILFIAEYIKGRRNFSELCERYGISRKTGYKWVKRYDCKRIEDLQDLSRKPHRSPLQTPLIIRKAIIDLRRHRKITPGAGAIQAILRRQHPKWEVPSRTTIYNILNREGLVEKQRRKWRVPVMPQPFAPVHGINEVWSADYKGDFKLARKQACYPLTIMDHHSRYLLSCKALTGTDTRQAKAEFTRAFQTYGLPERMRTDNGIPFASRSTMGLSRLSIWWIRLGIMPERIQPGKPQQNGQHERMHRTLKKATVWPPAKSMKGQQKRFDDFIEEYNERRPHFALEYETPGSLFQPSSREMPEKLPELEYPGHFTCFWVKPCGLIYLERATIYIGGVLGNEVIGGIQIDDSLWEFFFGRLRLGTINIGEIPRGTQQYLRLKV